MFARALSLASLTLLLAIEPASAISPKPDPRASGVRPQERLGLLMDRVRIEQEQLAGLRAAFVQRKDSQLLAEPQTATGVLSFSKPDKVRWEYHEPDPMLIIISGETMVTWFQDLKRAERMQIGRYSEQVFRFMGATAALDTLSEYFRVEASFPGDAKEPYRLELTPRYSRIAKKLQSMSIWIDAETFLPVRLSYHEADGDLTEYELKDLERDPELSEGLFDLTLPDDVAVREVDLGSKK